MDHRIMLGGMVITIIATAALAVVAICFFFSYLLKLIPTNIFVYIIVAAWAACEA